MVGDWEAGRFLLPEIDLCGGPPTLVSGSLDQAEDLAVNHDTLPYRWDPRVEKTTRTPYLEEMPITTEATTVHPNKCHYDYWA